MTWHTLFSFFTITFLYYNVWQIETYSGWCGNPVIEWIGMSFIVGSLGANLAFDNLIKIGQKPGMLNAISRIIDLTLVIGFTMFLLKYFAFPFVYQFLVK